MDSQGGGAPASDVAARERARLRELLRRYYAAPVEDTLAKLASASARHGGDPGATARAVGADPWILGSPAEPAARSAEIVSRNTDQIRRGCVAAAPAPVRGRAAGAPEPRPPRANTDGSPVKTGADRSGYRALDARERAAYREVVRAARQGDHGAQLRGIGREIHAARDRLACLDAAERDLAATRERVREAARRHYPPEGRARLDVLIKELGLPGAARTIREQPARLGPASPGADPSRWYHRVARRLGTPERDAASAVADALDAHHAARAAFAEQARVKVAGKIPAGADDARAALRGREAALVRAAERLGPRFAREAARGPGDARVERALQPLSPESRGRVTDALGRDAHALPAGAGNLAGAAIARLQMARGTARTLRVLAEGPGG